MMLKAGVPFSAFIVALSTAAAAPAAASEAPGDASFDQSLQVMAESQNLSDDGGSLDTLRGEFKSVDDDTTFIVTPAFGRRDNDTSSDSAFSLGVTLYQDYSNNISTRTQIAIAENEPVFPHYDVAQDITFGIWTDTTATFGARWAQYFGSQDVYFLTAGARYYFAGGSIAYRLSYVDPDNREAFLAHLINLSLSDAHGQGRTQLWLSAGAASIERAELDNNFSGEDYGAFIRRLQPLTEGITLIGSLGASSYDRPLNRVTATSVGLGLQVGF
jgi:YaiO family outer membrane protein